VARVLVADDDPDLLALARATLELAGHEVETASDGAEAVRKAVATSPDAVVLDIMMPKVDGLTALGQLRQGPKTQSIPVLLLSAKAGAIDIDVGMKAGAAGYITKPFAPADLVSAIVRITAKD
jgi:CheY-like chemotaxis protein